MTSHVIAADRIVLATGLADHVRVAALDNASVAHAPEDARHVAADNRIGLGATLPADAADLPFGELVMAVGREGYCGAVRLEDGRVDIAAAVSRESLGRNADPGRVVAAIVAEAVGRSSLPMPTTAAIAAAAFRATPPLTRSAPLVSGPMGQILRCGDAAGYVEPFTGEGIGWALASGRLVAEAMLADQLDVGDRLRSAADAAARYRAAHHRQVAAVHARCRRVALALRRPGVVMAAVQAARIAPWAARRLVPAVIGGESIGGGR
jgi:flavin-dependent dehydrogenase